MMLWNELWGFAQHLEILQEKKLIASLAFLAGRNELLDSLWYTWRKYCSAFGQFAKWWGSSGIRGVYC